MDTRLYLQLFGRESEVESVVAALAVERLVALVGIGGMGKTRIAQAACQRVKSEYSGGVYWIAVPEGNPGASLPLLVAQAVFPQEQSVGNTVEQLIAALKDRQMLVVLDAFEHFDGAEPALAALLAGCPELRVVVTSRTGLAMHYQRTLPVVGLPVPADDNNPLQQANNAAVRLFTDRAAHVTPDFNAARQGYAHIAHICWLVGGMPLAIELAASWVGAMSCAAIAAGIANRMDMLYAHYADLPERHQSIGVVLDETWVNLTPDARTSMMYLSVFEGYFSAEAAAAVLPDGLFYATVRSLLDTGLLKRPDKNYDVYHLHDVIRQYAERKLAEAPPEQHRAQGRYAQYYTGLLYDALPQIDGPQIAQGMTIIQNNLHNIRHALQYAIQPGMYGTLTTATHVLIQYYSILRLAPSAIDDLHEMRQLLSQYPATPDQRIASAYTEMMYHLVVAMLTPDYNLPAVMERIDALCESVQVQPDAVWERAIALNIRGQFRHICGQLDLAEADLRRCMSLLESVQDCLLNDWVTLMQLGRVISDRGRYHEAEEVMLRGLKICEDRQSVNGQMTLLVMYGLSLLSQGRFLESATITRRALDTCTAFPVTAALGGVVLCTAGLFHALHHNDVAIVLGTIAQRSAAGLEPHIKRQSAVLLARLQESTPKRDFAEAE
ncbi:MAG: NB-ARC domain-containing protein, partial [Chloroflexota bacterium]